MRAWFLVNVFLLTAGTLAGQQSFFQDSSACQPPDSAYLHWWLDQPEPDFATAAIGIIDVTPTDSRPSPPRVFSQPIEHRSLLGNWKVTLAGVRRDSSVTVRVKILTIMPADSGPAILTGKWRGTSPLGCDSDVLYGWEGGLGSLFFSTMNSNSCVDCGGLDILLSDKDGFSGLWYYGPALIPETYGYFCAAREQ